MSNVEEDLRTSVSLLEAVKDPTNGPAWAAFVARYDKPIRRWCRCQGLGPEAEDSVTERVLVKLLHRMRTFNYDAHKGTFRAWLRKVVRNEVRDGHRERTRRPANYGTGGDGKDLETLHDPNYPDVVTHLIELEDVMLRDCQLREILKRVRKRVDDHTWRAFWLTTIEVGKGKDVAEQLNMTVGAVFVAKHRVRENDPARSGHTSMTARGREVPMTDHPPTELLRAYLARNLDEHSLPDVHSHIEHCESCQEVLEGLMPSIPASILAAIPAVMDREPGPGFATTVSIPVDRGQRTASGHGRDALEPVLDRYELLKRIGAGGMGIVYAGRTRDTAVEHKVAIKVMLATHFASSGEVQRFLGEMEFLEEFQHRNVIEIRDSGNCADGRPYLVMPLARCSLAEVLKNKELMEPRATAECVATLARAVRYIHDKGYVHRDLKPSNILIDDSGQLWVADFGLAQCLVGDRVGPRPGSIEGTIPYLAPEQIEGPAPAGIEEGQRCDVWASA